MCTVSFIGRRHGFLLGMNRDEQRTRVTAEPPRERTLEGRTVLGPTEPGGGTWVGVNDAGVAFALINWYAVPARVKQGAISRGEVANAALATGAPDVAESVLERLELSRVNAFRLLGIFPERRTVVEWRWDLIRFGRVDHGWAAGLWVSSGFDESGAQRARTAVFRDRLSRPSAGSIDWLRRLHRGHDPERGAYSICMHRDDAVTVSFTEIAVTRQSAVMRYTPGAPCLARARPAGRLRLAVR